MNQRCKRISHKFSTFLDCFFLAFWIYTEHQSCLQFKQFSLVLLCTACHCRTYSRTLNTFKSLKLQAKQCCTRSWIIFELMAVQVKLLRSGGNTIFIMNINRQQWFYLSGFSSFRTNKTITLDFTLKLNFQFNVFFVGLNDYLKNMNITRKRWPWSLRFSNKKRCSLWNRNTFDWSHWAEVCLIIWTQSI